MFNYNAFTPNQNSSPVRAKPLQNLSPAYFPANNQPMPTWNPATYFTPPHQGPHFTSSNDDAPYNIKVPLGKEEVVSSESSDSDEETDTMPEVASKFATSTVKDWDFGQDGDKRRKSETFLSHSPGVIKTHSNPGPSNPKTWVPVISGRVSTKPVSISPLNFGDYTQSDKRSYFVTLEGFNSTTSQRFFKIERLCHSLLANNSGGTDGGAKRHQFLYIGLWNDINNSEGSENIFEPWVYAIPYLQFKIVVTVNMTHAYEDPFTLEFNVDLRQLALPTRDRRSQSLEVSFTEPGNNGNPGNNTTIHLQVTNEKLFMPHGFRNPQDPRQQSRQDLPFDYTVILRQIFIGVPLSRQENPFPNLSPLLFQNIQRPHDPYGKRGSAINLGQERRISLLENCPQSPISWSNFTPDISPTQKKLKQNLNEQEDPLIPPGILNSSNSMPPGISTNNNTLLPPGIHTNTNAGGSFVDTANNSAGPSLFKFKGQPRFSIQATKSEEQGPKRTNRIQSSDFSALLGEDKSPLKILEAYVNAVKQGNRRQSNISETSLMGRFQPHPGSIISTENDLQSQSVSSFAESVQEVPQEEPSNELMEEFRVEDYVGKMAEFSKTYQGSKVLQKHISTADKEDLDLVVKELGEKIGDLLLDPYANYIIQTLMQHGSPKHRLHILQKMAPLFISIARDKKGTHALQAIVAQINSPEEFAFIKHIIGNSVFELSMDPRANYVIQKLINTIPIDSSQFLYQPLLDNFVQVANNSFGLLVLKQMMARVEQKEALKQRVVELTCLNFEKLIQNPYGNYAIQHIMEFYPKESFLIMNKILLKIIPYSSQKISSNVIEKCLTVCDSQFRKRVVDEIIKNGRFGDLLKNKYGNFVTLQLLATTSPSDKKKLMQEIVKCANSFNGTKYKLRWLKFTQENPLKINWNNSEEEDKNETSGEGKEAVIDINKEEKLTDEQADQNQAAETAENLEAVKRIWREMTKEEKNDAPPPVQYGKQGGKRNYNNKREDNGGSWGERN